MSDERDTDAAGDGAENTGAITQRLRPTGKRSRQRAGGTALAEFDEETTALEMDFDDDEIDAKKSKKALKKAGDGKPSRNPFVFIATYLSQVAAELRKVIWPNRKEMVSYTSVVMVFLIFMVALIGVVDLGLAKLVLFVFGNG